MWMIIADLLECIILTENSQNLSAVDWTFFIIIEIIQYAIFTKLVVINDNKIFHVKGDEFLSTIAYLSRFLSREERNTLIICILYI